jgi:HTH-type transcriptional regulator/antitoxin HigA
MSEFATAENAQAGMAGYRPVLPVITDDGSYRTALARLGELMESPGADADELRALALLIEDYEDRTAPDFPLDAVGAIEFYMAQHGLNQAQFAQRAGIPAPRVSEILSRKRRLSMEMIRKLSALRLPLPSLIAEPRQSRLRKAG